LKNFNKEFHSDTISHNFKDPAVVLSYLYYCRMYGSYDEVTGGQTADAFMNLTAGVGESIKFEKMKMSGAQLHKRLRNA
jgi:hypothetical protein